MSSPAMFSSGLDLNLRNNNQHDTNMNVGNEKTAMTINEEELPQSQNGEQLPSSRASGNWFGRGTQREFKTYLLDAKDEKSWLKDKRYKAPRRGNWIIYIFIFLAFGFSALLNWRIASSVHKHDYCLILDDSFSSLNEDIWSKQVQIDGFGTGSFDWTTTDTQNAFTDGEGLHIVPTLTTASTPITEEQIHNGFALNLTKTKDGDGSCTAAESAIYYNQHCSILSNVTAHSIIPPVRSARLTTQGKKSIRYGRVEVTARLPKGDWLWPAIWMMPEESVYGGWPLSGEIDIMESRGNDRGYPGAGRESYMSTLHWGPSVKTNSFYKTTHARAIKRSDYTQEYHTFGIEWSKDYLYTYIDNRLQQVMYIDFKKIRGLWKFGQFEGRMENGTELTNPWFKSENMNAPFDQNFYLILNVAVGSRNGWFPDALGQKPWVDGRETAASDFYAARDKWLPTWGKGNERGMTIKNVKMWQEGKCSTSKN